MAAWVFVGTLAVALAVVYRRLGDYLYRVVAGRTATVAERGIYRLVGVDPNAEQTWGVYARGVLARLRRKLEADPAHPVHLRTEPGMGYRFDPGDAS